ncbi:alpha-2-macroglobulin receptor-associated protein isoform X1 [Camelus dromedarius]|uniref:alpha-2-macroglobulin receptor-associated protein isoform X1 n=1 Tax=Camelus dromedarius TaxID=9838 RepID=UPI00311A38D3
MASRRVRAGLRQLRPPPPPPLLLLLLLLGPWSAAGHGGKYSREKNEPQPLSKREPGGEFRMEKLSQLWEKAQRLGLTPVKLSELHADLKIQERDEFKWKKLKAEGLDEDGEKEAKLIRSLNVILAKYGLDGRKDARAVSSNFLSHDAQDDSLEDPRLEKLWHKLLSRTCCLDHTEWGQELGFSLPWTWTVSMADRGVHPRPLCFQAKTSGKFSSENLDRLWREFQHYQDKVHEYNVLLETLSGTEEVHENVVSPADMTRVKEEVLQSRHAELKDKLRDVSQGFERLRKVSHQGYGAQAEFEEPRVMDLWDLARAANFSEKELESFREELKHFEAKIEKHNHYQKQLEISHQKLKHVESFGDPEHISQNKERYALLEEKTKQLGYKVKKHLQDLSSRVSRARHNEL